MSLIIFDCDGVLVESEEILLSAELDFLSKAGLIFERDQYIRQFMGMPSSKWEEIIRRKLTAYLGKKPESDCFKKLNEFTAEKL